jgi:hypothetical protein
MARAALICLAVSFMSLPIFLRDHKENESQINYTTKK